jgi:hypothetical protein
MPTERAWPWDYPVLPRHIHCRHAEAWRDLVERLAAQLPQDSGLAKEARAALSTALEAMKDG